MIEFLQSLDFEQIAVIITQVIGAASLISLAITKITKVTPNTKDDEYAGKIAKAIGYVQYILDRVAANPKADEARK